MRDFRVSYSYIYIYIYKGGGFGDFMVIGLYLGWVSSRVSDFFDKT